jgi:hypothetical protein
MVYYIVTYRGVRYCNRASLKALRGVGDAGFLALLARKDIIAETLLDSPVYTELVPTDLLTLEAGKYIVTQDLDSQVLALKGKELTLERAGHKALKLKGANSYAFVPLDDVCVPDRYRWVKTQAHIKVFGKKYVAVAAK